MKRFHNTFSINFYCRTSKQNKAGQAPIEMGVNILGERFFINTGLRGKPDKFFKDAATRDYLSTIEQRIYEWHTECIKRGKQPTKQSLQEFILAGYKSPGKCLKSLYAGFFDSVEKRHLAGQLTAAGVAKYHQAIDPFFKGVDMDQTPDVITKKMITDWVCHITKSYKKSTGVGMLTKLKSLWLFARDNGYVNYNLFNGIKISKKVDEVVPPTVEEFERIRTSQLFNQSLEKVRDLWVFAAGCGLSYCDCAALKPEDFIWEGDMCYIKKTRGKTGVEFMSVLLPWAVEIVKRYNYVLPIISNQKINTYLKTIGDICGVKVSLHFHLARHYYCHQLLNVYHLSYETAAKCLGHTTTKQTMHYGKMWDNTVLGEFRAVL